MRKMTTTENVVSPGMTAHTTSGSTPTDWGSDKILATTVLDCMAEEVYACNVANEWFEEDRTFGDDIALLHSEVSEMLEAFRDGQMTTSYEHTVNGEKIYGVFSEVDGVLGKPIGMPCEAADVLVRLLDTCKRYDIDLFAEFRQKLDYNWTRGPRHGGKAL